MKRYLALFLALVMCFSLAACSNDGESITDDPSAPDSEIARERRF